MRKRESRCRVGEAQEQDVIRIDHGRIGDVAMRFPNRSAVKSIQRLCACGHVVESAQPDELIRVIEIPKLTDDLQTHSFLRFDKFAVEEFDQGIAFSGVKRVLPELDDGGMSLLVHTRLNSMIQFVSQVLPPSAESACSH